MNIKKKKKRNAADSRCRRQTEAAESRAISCLTRAPNGGRRRAGARPAGLAAGDPVRTPVPSGSTPQRPWATDAVAKDAVPARPRGARAAYSGTEAAAEELNSQIAARVRNNNK